MTHPSIVWQEGQAIELPVLSSNARVRLTYERVMGAAVVSDVRQGEVRSTTLAAPTPMLVPTKRDPVNVFVSYSHLDRIPRLHLWRHMSPLHLAGLIHRWDDQEIRPGENWRTTIDKRLERADLILLLVSECFVSSHFCMNIEAKRAMELHRTGRAVVVPVILRQVLWKETFFGCLQAVPNGDPINRSRPQGDGYFEAVNGLRRLILKHWPERVGQSLALKPAVDAEYGSI